MHQLKAKRNVLKKCELGAAVASKNNTEISNPFSFVRRFALHLRVDLYKDLNWMDLPMIDPTATIRWDSDTAPTQQFFRIPILSFTCIHKISSDYSNPSSFESIAITHRSIKVGNKNKRNEKRIGEMDNGGGGAKPMIVGEERNMMGAQQLEDRQTHTQELLIT